MLANLARLYDRATVSAAVAALPLQKLQAHSNAELREAAARLLFELREGEPEGENGGEVPPEVLARGARAEALFHKALAEGSAPGNSAKVVLLGDDRGGKTCVLSALVGAPWEPEEESTHGVATSCYKLVNGDWQEDLGDSRHAEMIAVAVAEGLRGGDEAVDWQEATPGDEASEASAADRSRSHDTLGLKLDGVTSPTEDATSAIGSTSSPVGGSSSALARVTSMTDLPLDLIAAALRQPVAPLRVVYKDTAGQPRYFCMLARSLSKCSVPVIVLNLTRWARYVVKHEAFQDVDVGMSLNCSSGRATGDRDEESTIGCEELHLRYWLSMVLVRTEGTPVLIVGTHYDEVCKVLGDDVSKVRSVLPCHLQWAVSLTVRLSIPGNPYRFRRIDREAPYRFQGIDRETFYRFYVYMGVVGIIRNR